MNNLKVLEMEIKLFKKEYSKAELLISNITAIISCVILFKSGLIISLISSIIINFIIKKIYIKFIKKEQERLKI
jgi:hypothetical protein